MNSLTKKEDKEFYKKRKWCFQKKISMSYDIRICLDIAVFEKTEVGLGIIPGFGGTQRIARLIGIGMAK